MRRARRDTEDGRPRVRSGRWLLASLALGLVATAGCAPAGGAPPGWAPPGRANGEAAHGEPAVRAGEATELERLRDERDALRLDLEQREAELARAERARAEAEARVAELSAELGRKEEQRMERERGWLAFTRALSRLELEALERLPQTARFEPDAELTAELDEQEAAGASADDVDQEPDPEAARAASLRARSEELGRRLRTLFRVDGLRGMDLLEAGSLGDGWTGPVVFRLVDPDGRLSGSLVAERLRLEASRTARTVTLVLEDGHETWRGARTGFETPDPDPGAASVRRVVLPRVDPDPWLEALPELFAETPLGEAPDDGVYNALQVRGELNQLLRRDAAGGWFRVRSLAGVRADVLRGVHLEGFDAGGKLERHLFADRLRVLAQERGVLLQLEDGAQVRGDDKAAFLDGRFRIYLPRADVEEWAARGIPGVAPAPGTPEESAAERAPDPESARSG